MHWGLLMGRRIFSEIRRLALFLLIASPALALPPNAVAESELGLVTRSDWFGDPYLLTNPPGSALSPYRVVLVMNPALVTNLEYQAKVAALSATEVAESPEPLGTHALRMIGNPANTQASQPTGLSPASVAPAQETLPAREADGGEPWPITVQHWLLLGLATGLLVFRIWRYFFEREAADDFANYLETLAVAHRWVFPVYLGLVAVVAVAEFLHVGNLLLSLSVLALAFSLRRYYCEGDFADYPVAQKVHLAMRLGLVGLGLQQVPDNYLFNLGIWFTQPLPLLWLVLAVATVVFSVLYNHHDLAEHRRDLFIFMAGFGVSATLGSALGYLVWVKSGGLVSVWLLLGAGATLGCLPLGYFFYRWNQKVLEGQLGRLAFDLIFSEGAFAEKNRKKKHLPELLLLRHWRDRGEVDKAWRTAQAHLFREARALPIWLFAMETAVLYLRQPGEALRILAQLLNATEEFHYDHRTVAVGQMQGWMAAAGFPFDAAQFKVTRPPKQDTGLTEQVTAKCRAGRFGEAETLLQNVLADDSLNEAAFTELVRLYCQDMKKRPAAERLLAEASETFGPNFLNHLSGLLDEWIKLPIRSTAPRKTLLDWFRRPAPAPVVVQKLSLGFSSAPQPGAPLKPADPLDAYLARVKEAHGRPADTANAQDQIEKLLLERRLGTAIEMLKKQADVQPENFEVWLRYAEAHAVHCGDLTSAEKIIRQMAASQNFKKAEMRKIHARLKKWRAKNPNFKTSW